MEKKREAKIINPKRVAKIILLGFVCLILSFCCFAGVLFKLAYDASGVIRQEMFALQETRLAELSATYEAGTAIKVNEQDFCGFDLNLALSDEVKLNELQYMGTHNSYKTGISKQSSNLFKYVEFTTKYEYSFDTLTEQLNHGIRSFELDLLKVPTEEGYYIECSHKYLSDNMSSAIDLLKGLQEIAMWSAYNENHLPIIILLEPKYKGITAAPAALKVEDIFALGDDMRDIFGDTLITPADLLGDYDGFDALRNDNGYPTISNMLGKVIFALHNDKLTTKYAQSDLTMQTQAIFPMPRIQSMDKIQNYSNLTCFALQNDAMGAEKFEKLIDEGNFIVRTRLDSFPIYSELSIEKAIISKANILSTDYPPALIDRFGFTVKFDEQGSTILLRNKQN
jgi:hypothetical protein